MTDPDTSPPLPRPADQQQRVADMIDAAGRGGLTFDQIIDRHFSMYGHATRAAVNVLLEDMVRAGRLVRIARPGQRPFYLTAAAAPIRELGRTGLPLALDHLAIWLQFLVDAFPEAGPLTTAHLQFTTDDSGAAVVICYSRPTGD